jgi:type VI secretion system secreted protein VgrG
MLSISVLALIVGASSTAALASTAPGLGKATSFAVLAGTTVTNTGPTVITGDLGVSPGTAVTHFPPGTVTGGAQYTGATSLAGSAQSDLTTAYLDAFGSPCEHDVTAGGGELGGKTLIPGTYCSSSALKLTGTLILSGSGVFIFKAASSKLTTASGSTVSLTNGAQPCNVFWQIGSSAVIGSTTTFVGTIMALTSISLANGAKIAGRALARNGAVTLINNKITAPTTCNAATVSTSTSTSTPTPTPAVPGIPRAGTGPSQGDGFPWILAMVTGVLASGGAVGLGISVRTRRRSRQ